MKTTIAHLLADQRESIKNDIICLLDGIDQVDDTILDNVCQVIVDRFAILSQRLHHQLLTWVLAKIQEPYEGV